MITSQRIIQIIENLAPKSLMLEGDNVGLMVGDYRQKVSKVLMTLTATLDSIEYAASNRFDMLISHHPLFYKPVKSIRKDLPLGALVYKAIENNITIYSAHTNLDIACGGVNDVLARTLGLTDIEVLTKTSPEESNEDVTYGLGRLGYLKAPMTLMDFVESVKNSLEIEHLRFVGNSHKTVSKVAVCGGSGSGMASKATLMGADVLVTGDVKYHDAESAIATDMAIVDAGHFPTENIMMPILAQYLKEQTLRSGLDLDIEVFAGQDPFTFL